MAVSLFCSNPVTEDRNDVKIMSESQRCFNFPFDID